MRYAIPALAAFFLLAFFAGFLASRPLTSAKARSPGESALSARAENDDGWRRTADGWEHIRDWERPASPSLAAGIQQIHPLVGAAMVLLLSIGALIASSGSRVDILDARLKKFIAPLR